MKYFMFKLAAKGPDGRQYTCTMFHQHESEPDPQYVVDNACRQYPIFTEIRVLSVQPVSLEEYSFRVRQMSDSDEWGFHPLV
ncbi:hypothetical protein [Dyadobacter sp. 676]|uniref:Uncharacterized protein n=1 Tax=Dyadobacter sp. 676 TaxID=3088362 RepID=A0AAU8FN13_9BACT